MYDIAIIGAGIIGTAVARELAKYKLKIVLIEKNNDVANEATAANGGIIYDGYNAKANKLKGQLTIRGNELYDTLCHDLGVRFKRTGLLMLAFGQEDQNTLQDLYNKGLANNILDLRLLDKEKVLEMEPGLSDKVVGALYSPSCGIIYPWELAIALAENAIDNGVKLLLNSEVRAIEKEVDNFKVVISDRVIQTKYVINCAGARADKINEMIGSPDFKITPKRGQYIVLDKSAGELINRIIIPCKTEQGKEAFVIPTIGGNLLLGPAMESVADSEANQVSDKGLASIRKSISENFPILPLDQTIQAFAGIKAKIHNEDGNSDFIIEESREVRGFINVAGINSPGLTCAPAIAEYVVQMVRNMYQTTGEVLAEKKKFNPCRKRVIRLKDLNEQQKADLIQAKPQYGQIVCRCEMITEGEIVDAIHRNCGATTLKGLKRCAGSSLGRCQGGFCGPKIVKILARELGQAMDEVRYDHMSSYILKGQI